LFILGVLFWGGVWIGDGDTSFFCIGGTTVLFPLTLGASIGFSTGLGTTLGGSGFGSGFFSGCFGAFDYCIFEVRA
jgi:hypothetical protein